VESQGGGGSGAEKVEAGDYAAAAGGEGQGGPETPQQRIDRVRAEYGIGTGSGSDIDPRYDPDLKLPGATTIDRSKLGSPEAVTDVRIGPGALKGSDDRLAVVLNHEYSSHVEPAIAGTHPFDMSTNPTVFDPRTGTTLTDVAYESFAKFNDAQYALSIGDWSDYQQRMALSERLLQLPRFCD
jgi:hypothetical protein